MVAPQPLFRLLNLAAPPAMLLVDSSPERAEAVVMSPTPILQTAAAASPTSPAAACGGNGTGVPFSRTGGGGSGDRRSKSHRPWDEKPVGLGLVDALNGEGAHDDDDVVACASTVLAGQKLLRVQPTSLAPRSPPSTEFGVKNKSSRSGSAASPPAHAAPPVQPRHASPRRRGCLSPREMEMSEDYTRVIARGPNPRTTHIFDNRVVETSGGSGFSSERETAAAASCGGDGDDFLRRCHGCGKDLGQGKDIFMYRGERAFCSRECRHREMAFDDGMEEL